MALGLEFYMKRETLQTLLDVVTKKGEKGVAITGFTKDESDQYGNNFSGWVKQSKEDSEAKKDRFFVANGKVFWSDGKVTVASKQEQKPVSKQVVEDDSGDLLPF